MEGSEQITSLPAVTAYRVTQLEAEIVRLTDRLSVAEAAINKLVMDTKPVVDAHNAEIADSRAMRGMLKNSTYILLATAVAGVLLNPILLSLAGALGQLLSGHPTSR